MPAKGDDTKVETKEKDAANKASALKDKNLQAALAAIEKQYGSGSIMRFGDETARVNIPVIPTGALSLDLALGVGGIPRGRITEVFGPEEQRQNDADAQRDRQRPTRRRSGGVCRCRARGRSLLCETYRRESRRVAYQPAR